jgi:acetyl-CoA synthetase
MSSAAPSHITSVLKEQRTFLPPPEFAARARINSLAVCEKLWQRARDDPEGFWSDLADTLHWDRRWDRVLVWNEPHAQWFAGGKLNSAPTASPCATARRSITRRYPRAWPRAKSDAPRS